ncbi:hypothetical protein HYC85_021053 [Camellia sinensis]|uniref:Uncharacterized protein n=1 Tax=Camellia sinensis TaxID=4442 RepID=A0A7J7GKD3_CAMSI|nr:hypothetical protein HYC85_021053 [Camellia sinensis]
MGDHFVLLVDRFLTESTLEAAIESLNLSKQTTTLGTEDIKIDISSRDIHSIDCSIPRKIVECKICQDEDEDSNMETPCSCCGSLNMFITDAYKDGVTRKVTVCVRYVTRWPFKPGYTTPPPMFQLGSIPMNFRGNWEISRRDLNNPCFIAMVTTEPNFVDPDYDEYAAFESRSLFCCRSVCHAPLFITQSPLKRQAQNLDINPWFPNTTNLFQTCPIRPKTHIQRVKDGNGNKTTTHLRNRVRNTIKQ